MLQAQVCNTDDAGPSFNLLSWQLENKVNEKNLLYCTTLLVQCSSQGVVNQPLLIFFPVFEAIKDCLKLHVASDFCIQKRN